jgi:hypothetical protein
MTPSKCKALFLAAFRKTAWKYRHPWLWEIVHFKKPIYGREDSCPICLATVSSWEFNASGCKPCPMAKENGYRVGCLRFASYPRYVDHSKFKLRALALDRMVAIMSKWPASRFTVEGWKYSGNELPRSW